MRCDNVEVSPPRRRPQECSKSPGLKSPSRVAKDVILPVWSNNQKVIISHFSAQYEAVFIKPEPIKDRLKALIDVSHNIHTSMQQLITLRNDEQKIIATQTQVSALFEAINNNDTYILGRAYFLEFVNRYQLSFEVLLTAASEQQRKALLSIKSTLEMQPNQWTKVASIVFAPLITLGRISLSSQTQELLNSYLPQTLDAQAKQLMKEVARDVLRQLQNTKKEINGTEENILNLLSCNNSDVKKQIQNESSEGLSQFLALPVLPLNAQDLEIALSWRLVLEQVKSSACVSKLQIQELLQRHYLQIMDGRVEEREKMDVLLTAMQNTVVLLNDLIDLTAEKEKLIAQYQPINALAQVVIEHASNAFIGAAVNDTLARLNQEISALDKEIEKQALFCAREDKQLQACLQQSTVEHLRELQQPHRIDKQTETLLLRSAATLTPDPMLLDADDTLKEYFNQHYSALIEQKRPRKNERLQDLIECSGLLELIEYVDSVETQLRGIKSVRQEADKMAVRIAQVNEVLALLQKQENESMFTHLMIQRLEQLHKMAKQVDNRKEELLHAFSQGNADLKNKLINHSYNAFDTIIEEHQVLKDCMKEYLQLSDKIQLLVELKKSDSFISDFITKRESWWVQLTNFLAQFFSFFQTEVGDRVNKAKALKLEIENLSTACEQEILTHIEKIQSLGKINPVEQLNPPFLGDTLLGDLPLMHDYKRTQSSQTFDTEKASHLLANVSFFQPSTPSSMSQAPEENEKNATAKRV
ncbi:MAG: hypothetical protein CK426_05670 [Legionella sp.]|nr:MAG: hypothetical protein CK423_06930 [Legionella sp.]PJD98532.1 MAG: hypothetical protein CK426_05670 [Legionella sp.]